MAASIETAPRPEPVRASDGERLLVVIGGLPGAGKTTLLRRLLAERVPGVLGYDSEQVADRLRPATAGLPYRLLRPLVHSWHRTRVLRGVRGPAPVVLVTDPWTSAAWRATALVTARRARRTVRLVLLDEAPESARAGQVARGRTVAPRALRRHARRWERLLRAPGGTARAVLLVDRRAAERLSVAAVVGPNGQRPAAPLAPLSAGSASARSRSRNR